MPAEASRRRRLLLGTPVRAPANYPCSFCENFEGRYPWHGEPAVVYEDELLYVLMAPAALGGMPGHVLVCTKRHVETILDLTHDEEAALGHAVARVARAVDAAFEPDGILVQQNNGEAAFQTVPHVHVHVIPKRGGSPFPPEQQVPITPSEERRVLARRVRDAWDAYGAPGVMPP